MPASERSDGKHTPGPWEEYRFGEGSTIAVRGADGTIVAKACWNQADARLIAAAPEMLAALQEIAESRNFSLHIEPAVQQRVRAALAKAEGRET